MPSGNGDETVKISVREFVMKILDERDRYYESKFEAAKGAVDTALEAQESAVNSAFKASEKAIEKSENAQHSYNSTHNDLSRKMDEQYKNMMPRTEVLQLIDSLKEKVADLQKSRDTGTGIGAGKAAGWAFFLAALGVISTIVALFLVIKGGTV